MTSPATTTQTTKTTKQPPNGPVYNAKSSLDFVTHYEEQAKKNRDIAEKYHSIDSLSRSDKVNALKDVNLNPYGLADPYDGLANSFERWKTVAAGAKDKSQLDKDIIAKNYYKKMIAPLYGGMGKEPMSESLWVNKAYSEALDYKIEDAYNNSFIHQVKNGWHEGVPALARGSEFLYNAAGNLLEGAVANWRKQSAERALPDSERQAHLATPWYSQAKDLVNSVASIGKERDNAVSRGAQTVTDNQDFWAQAVPSYNGFLNKMTSTVIEQVPSLPFFMLGGPEKNLTKELITSKLGKWAFGTLMAGTEGLAYGTATRKQEDKKQAWQDAVGFGIFHNIFEVGGLGLKKLTDVAEGTAAERAAKKSARLDLAQEGKRPATPVEEYQQHVKHESNAMAVVGPGGVQAKFTEALHYISDMDGRGWTKDQIKDHELRLLDKDPARFGPMLTSAKYIRSLLGAIGKPLGAIEPGSEDEKFLASRIAKLIHDAGTSMNENVEGLDHGNEKETAEQVKTPSAKHTLDYYRAKASAQIARENPAALKMMKPEELDAYATKLLEKDKLKAAALAEKKLNSNPVKEATNIAKRSKETPAQQAGKKNAPLKIKSDYRKDKFGQPSASYKAEKDYKVRFDQYKKDAKAKGQTLAQFFENMDDSDFSKDLSEHFYPKALRDAEVFFEGQHTKEGTQNPNFLAFMYNYTHTMPREFGKELENRLIDTMKVQKYMSGRKPTEPQLDYFAGAMYNHVDNFLGSGRWPKEQNIFRSSNEDMFNSTRWQMKLLREKQIQERKNLSDMFSGNPRAQRAAMITYRTLSKQRMTQYEIGPKDMSSQSRIRDLDDKIATHQEQTGTYDRWKF